MDWGAEVGYISYQTFSPQIFANSLGEIGEKQKPHPATLALVGQISVTHLHK